MTRCPRWPLIKAVSLTAFPQFFYAIPNTRIKSHINVTSVTKIWFTRELSRFVMLVLHVHLQMFFSERASKLHLHKEAWRLQICSVGNDALCAKCDKISLKKENIQGRKWYVLNLGTATFDENETIESKCIFGNHLKPGLSWPGGPTVRPQVCISNTKTPSL